MLINYLDSSGRITANGAAPFVNSTSSVACSGGSSGGYIRINAKKVKHFISGPHFNILIV